MLLLREGGLGAGGAQHADPDRWLSAGEGALDVLYSERELGYALEGGVPVGVTLQAFQVEASRWH
jgi:hypothetical protein